MLTSIRTMYTWVPGTVPVVAPTGGGSEDRRVRRTRVPFEQALIAMWASGDLTDEELLALLAGV